MSILSTAPLSALTGRLTYWHHAAQGQLILTTDNKGAPFVAMRATFTAHYDDSPFLIALEGEHAFQILSRREINDPPALLVDHLVEIVVCEVAPMLLQGRHLEAGDIFLANEGEGDDTAWVWVRSGGNSFPLSLEPRRAKASSTGGIVSAVANPMHPMGRLDLRLRPDSIKTP